MVARPWHRGTASARATSSIVPAAGELAVEVDTSNLVVADGTSTWAVLKRLVRLDEVTTAVQQYVTSVVVTNSSLAALAAESGYVYAVVDANGKIALGVTPAGNVIGKISIAAGTLNATSFDVPTNAQLTGAGAGPQLQPLNVEQAGAYLLTIQDSIGRMALNVAPDGTVAIPKLTLAAGSIDTPQLAADVLAGLNQAEAIESGYAWSVVDANGRIGLGLTPNGTLFAPKTSFATFSLRDADSSTYLAHPYQDSTGRYQIKVNRKSDAAVTISTTSSSVDTVEPAMAADGLSLLYRDNSTGTMRTYYRPLDGTGSTYPVIAGFSDGLSMWGDSLTIGNGSTNGGVPGVLGSLLGCNVANEGISGQGTPSVASRQGGIPALVTVTSNQIPASGAVNVTSISAIPYNSGGTGTGTLAGVPGTLTDVDGTNFTFTRTTSGSIVACPANTPWISDLSLLYASTIQIFWVGAHDLAAPSTITSGITAMIAYIKTYLKRALVLQVPPDSVLDAIGGTRRVQWSAANAAIAAGFPNSYVPVSDWLQSSGLAAVGLSPTSQDTTDIANGVTPTSLRSDTLHLNNAGYQAVAIRLQQTINSKGWT